MSFRSPLLLILLVLPALALAGYVLAQRRPPRHAISFPNLTVLATVVPTTRQWRRHVPAALMVAALAALMVALARPQIAQTAARSGSTVILVVDVSGSMRANDVKPSRIEAARQAMLRFVDKAPKGLRIGVIAFSAEPAVIAEPTANHDLVREAIKLITPGTRTAIGDAIARAVELARSSADIPAGSAAAAAATPASQAPAAIVLLSDGAQTAGLLSPDDGAARAKDAGIRISTVALGTPNGTLDRGAAFGPGNGGGGFNRDPGFFGGGGPGNGPGSGGFGGGRIPVPPDPVTLARIAETTGGTAFTAQTATRLNSIYSHLGESVERVHQRTEITAAAVGAAVVLLLGAGLLAGAWSPRLP